MSLHVSIDTVEDPHDALRFMFELTAFLAVKDLAHRYLDIELATAWYESISKPNSDKTKMSKIGPVQSDGEILTFRIL